MATPVARKPRKNSSVEASHAPPAPAPTTTTGADIPPPPPNTVMGTIAAETVGADLNAPMPPALDEALAVGDGVQAGWVYNRAITHLWSYDDPAGVWVWVDGIGWKRLSPASVFGHSHMTELATIATHRNIAVDYHEDASGQIDQLLV